MRKFNKGFIQLPFLIFIITSVLTFSAGTGIVFHKWELPFVTKKDKVVQPAPSSSPVSTQELPAEILEPTELEEKIEEALTPIKTQYSFINDVPSSIPESTFIPFTVGQKNTTTTQQPQTYSIIPLGNISSFPERERILWTNAYNEFLQTPNLQYIDHEQQNKYFIQIVDKYYIRYKQGLENEIQEQQAILDQLQTETSESQNQSNPEIENKLAELRQTLEHIQNQPVAMSIIKGRSQRAYQDWVNNNPEIYSAILGSRYINDLNTILTIYGL